MALRLTPAGDRAVIITEGIFTAAGVGYPTSRWQPGEVVRAHFDLFVPNDITPGKYAVSVNLVDQSGAPERGRSSWPRSR